MILQARVEQINLDIVARDLNITRWDVLRRYETVGGLLRYGGWFSGPVVDCSPTAFGYQPAQAIGDDFQGTSMPQVFDSGQFVPASGNLNTDPGMQTYTALTSHDPMTTGPSHLTEGFDVGLLGADVPGLPEHFEHVPAPPTRADANPGPESSSSSSLASYGSSNTAKPSEKYTQMVQVNKWRVPEPTEDKPNGREGLKWENWDRAIVRQGKMDHLKNKLIGEDIGRSRGAFKNQVKEQKEIRKGSTKKSKKRPRNARKF